MDVDIDLESDSRAAPSCCSRLKQQCFQDFGLQLMRECDGICGSWSKKHCCSWLSYILSVQWYCFEEFGRHGLHLQSQELCFVWSESEELMLEFAESVPFYGNMGRPQVETLERTKYSAVFTQDHMLTPQKVCFKHFWTILKLIRNSNLSFEVYPNCCVLFDSIGHHVDQKWVELPSFRSCDIGLCDGILSGGWVSLAVPAASCWATDSMRLVARGARCEQMSDVAAKNHGLSMQLPLHTIWGPKMTNSVNASWNGFG